MTVEEQVPLARYSTLHVGGKARYFTRITRLAELRDALSFAEEHGMPWFILGGGANFFCREEGFPGLVIKMENRDIEIPKVQFPMTNNASIEVTAEAGVLTRMLVLKAVEHGLRGMEHLAGIPGTVGGAVRGNAGSFGTEAKDLLTRVRVLERTPRGWEERELPKQALSFAYRDSTFKREPRRYVIWSASFSLPTGDRPAGERLVAEDLAARKDRQPYEFPSVGSIFKNPKPGSVFAGQLIEAAGLKGLRVGGMEVSGKHANFIVNRGGATATEANALIREVVLRVQEQSGISLEEEIVML